MTAYLVRRLLFVCALIALPAAGYAQEAVLTGTVTDSTGAVLPGVTVVAVNDATGNRYEGVTDERGIYRLPARVGAYTISAQLSGFTTATRSGLQLLVGQTATVDLQMAPSTVQETVTVTAETPLLNVATSSLGANINPEQVEELPVAGRNWMGLALLAPGSRTAPEMPRRRCRIATTGKFGSSSSIWTDSRSRLSSAPATSRSSARTRSRSSSSSRTGSMRHRVVRAVSR